MSFYKQGYTPSNQNLLQTINNNNAAADAYAQEEEAKQFNLSNALVKGLSAWAMTGFTNPLAGLAAGATAPTGKTDLMSSFTQGASSGSLANNMASTPFTGNPLDALGNMLQGNQGAIQGQETPLAPISSMLQGQGQPQIQTQAQQPLPQMQPQQTPMQTQAQPQGQEQPLTPIQTKPTSVIRPVKIDQGDNPQIKYLKEKINMMTKQTDPAGLDFVKKDIDTNKDALMSASPDLYNDAEAIYQALRVKLGNDGEYHNLGLASPGKVSGGAGQLEPIQGQGNTPVQSEGNLLDNIGGAVGQLASGIGNNVLKPIGDSIYKGAGDMFGNQQKPEQMLKLSQYLQTLEKPGTETKTLEGLAKRGIEKDKLKAESLSQKKAAYQVFRTYLDENKGLTTQQKDIKKIVEELLNNPDVDGEQMWKLIPNYVDALKQAPTIEMQNKEMFAKKGQDIISKLNKATTPSELIKIANENQGTIKELPASEIEKINKVQGTRLKELQKLSLDIKKANKIGKGKSTKNNTSVNKGDSAFNDLNYQIETLYNSGNLADAAEEMKRDLAIRTDLTKSEKSKVLVKLRSLGF